MSYYTSAQRNGESWAKPMPPYVSKPSAYAANLYRDSETGRTRWAVLELSIRVWYFPKHYGMRAAVAMARRLNRGA